MGDAVIVACATPWGRGALAVLRLSGGGLSGVLAGFVRPHSGWPLPVGRPRRVDAFDEDGVFDDGVIVYARAGRSPTGEPSAEITLHGNPLIVERALRAAVRAGARLARPGEFTRRAFLHGKLDLVQAEAVQQLAEASTSVGLAVARAGLDGRLIQAIAARRGALGELAAELEARIDHPEQDLEIGPARALVGQIVTEVASLQTLAGSQPIGHALVHGVRAALIGPVNAGKSSLLNALIGERRVLVHDRPGTTRDVVEARAVCDGLSITWIDTAGQRDTDDPVEREGIVLANHAAERADVRLIVWRARPSGPTPEERAILAAWRHAPHVLIYNGIDVPGAEPPPPGAIPTVATTGRGIDAILPAVRRALALGELAEARVVIASARQRDLLLAAARLCDEAAEALEIAGPTVAAELLIEALEALGEISGATARDEVLDTLFARFCLGK